MLWFNLPIHPIKTSLSLQWKVWTTIIIWNQAYSTLLAGECLEVSLQKNLNCLQLASISLLRPLHSLPQGSGFSAFLRRTNNHLQHLNSDLTSLSSGLSLSVCPSSSLTFFSEASASWLHSKYCFDQQQSNPFIAKWNPNMESAGKYFHWHKLLFRLFWLYNVHMQRTFLPFSDGDKFDFLCDESCMHICCDKCCSIQIVHCLCKQIFPDQHLGWCAMNISCILRQIILTTKI